MNERKKILWLVGWYPNKYDAFDGDFIQRHAKAAAIHYDVYVLFVKQFEAQKQTETSINKFDGLTEEIVYLPKQKGVRGKFRNYGEWQSCYKARVKALVEKQRPDLIHVHIPWKAGLIALWAQKRFSFAYIVTEHWGIYNNVVNDNIYTKSFLVRSLFRQVYKKAAALVSVSNFLGEAVNKTLVKKTYRVIPNVVDTDVFYPGEAKQKRFTFLHVSSMIPLKNVEGILLAFKDFLKKTGADAQLIMVGNKDDFYPSVAREFGLLNAKVFFKGEIPYNEVARQMQHSHALVVNSNIENSPCVIGEALCCGLPVIATNVGGIPELVGEKEGLLVPPQDGVALANAMMEMYQQYERYDAFEIAAVAKEKFSVQTIGRAFSALYGSILV